MIWSNPCMSGFPPHVEPVRAMTVTRPRSAVALDPLADAQALCACGRTPHRFASGAAGHDHDEIARLVDDGNHGGVVILVDPHRKVRALRLAAVLDHAPGLAPH